jgi:hypothetical protein
MSMLNTGTMVPMTCPTLANLERQQIGLHYTDAGYDRFGELLYEHLKTTPLLATVPSSTSSTTPSTVTTSTAAAPTSSSTTAVTK